MTYSRSELLEVLDQHEIRAKRSLGQNFVADANTVRKIAHLAQLTPESHAIEIGAGAGSLTLALLETGATVVCVEIDKQLVELLQNKAEIRGAKVVVGDAMDFEWTRELSGHDDWVLVANLPYNIATPLVVEVLERVPNVAKMLVMVQEEVGRRFAAGPNDSECGAVSMKIAYFADAKIVSKVPATVFVPKPRVESALVEITRRESVAIPVEEVPTKFVFDLINTGYGQRRKQLQKSLRGIAEPTDFVTANVPSSARPQELSIDQWGELAKCIFKRTQN